MTAAIRKLPIEDIAKLQALVVENFDAIEPGLTVLDARLLLGHATIDVIGVDATGALVLGAVGFTANEEMLLKAVEAYSWCLEYPQSLVRLYPSCQLSDDRPPRLLFVVERMPDAFHRKIKQLGFPEVDCIEVRHLDFDGVSAVYFETLLSLRRHPVSIRAVEPEREAAPSPDPVADGGPVARSAAARIQKVVSPGGGADSPAAAPRAQRAAPVREPAPVVSMISRQAVVTARAERPRPAPEPLVLREPEPLMPEIAPEPVAPASPEPVAVVPAIDLPSLTPVPPSGTDEPRVSFKDLAAALLDAAGVSAEAQAAEAPGRRVIADIEIPPVPSVVTPEPAEIALTAETPQPPMPEPVVPADPAPALTVEALVASAPAVSAAAPRTEVTAEAAKPALGTLPQEFEGLKFPNDGVLTRQWLEFLNQMSGKK